MNHEDLDQMVGNWVSTREKQKPKTKILDKRNNQHDFWRFFMVFKLENCGKIIFYDGMGRRNEYNSIKLEIEKVVEHIFPVRG